MEKTGKSTGREPLMDILKGCCILGVIVTHLPYSGQERLYLLYEPFWASMAVPGFMIISGYLYTKAYQRAGIQTLAQAYEKHFLCRHILRFTVPFALIFAGEWAVGLGEFQTGGGYA